MLCPVCGSERSADVDACITCSARGQIVPDAPTITPPPTEPILIPEGPLPIPVELQPEAAAPSLPYSRLTAQILGLGLCLSVAALNTTSNIAHAYWRVWPVSVVASIVAVALMFFIPGSWRKIENVEVKDPDEAAYPRKVLTRCLIFVLIFIVIGAFVGSAIGRNGRQTAELVADFKEMSRLGKSISQARDSAARTVPANIDMYASIRGDVERLDSVLHRLSAELLVYDERFPDQHETTLKSIRTVETSLKRSDLLKQQIGVAADIDGLTEESRWQAWKDRMEPLLRAEDALDKN